VTGHTIVQESTARWGGKCRHCEQWIGKTEPTFKVYPYCCEKHKPKRKSTSKNGPGSWLCTSCTERFVNPVRNMGPDMRRAAANVLRAFPGARFI
jgi:hypothetical protein